MFRALVRLVGIADGYGCSVSAGELITSICWLLLIVGSVGWLAFGLVRVNRRRHHRRWFRPAR
ncbi:hypothetical protein [Cryptosporangium japonicum]|uniref:Uncharacterized protein n=1 Tax=Cryptosporangium japonicum TaxID=80872 RepID=A0ABP3EHY6_9ACTN